MAIYQIFVKLLDGETRCLQFSSPILSGESLKTYIHQKTQIPVALHRLVTGTREIHDRTLISASETGFFPSCTLLLRLNGGKGGFGSLLRGAATKAGQKKTNNFDACRDMSGRRLRHVNAEKKLEEWRAGAENRKLEKIAEQFLKKKAKEVKKTKSGEVEKYIEKYKEDSERCMGEVEESVRQSFMLYEKSKRKVLPSSGPASKRLKVWLGKEVHDESDSDDEEDSDYEDEKSVVLDAGNQKNDEGSGGTGTFSEGQSDGESLDGRSSQSNLEEEKNELHDQNRSFEFGEGSGSRSSNDDSDNSAEPETIAYPERSLEAEEVKEGTDDSTVVSQEQMRPLRGTTTCSPENLFGLKEVELMEACDPSMLNEERIDDIQTSPPSSSENCPIGNEVNLVTEKSASLEPAVRIKVVYQSIPATNSTEPLNFDDISSAVELEVIGMERLKKELQANGLKCGGTLQERAARLFLLKTTPVGKLPKKLLAKPTAGK